jgi:hypothetical protein
VLSLKMDENIMLERLETQWTLCELTQFRILSQNSFEAVDYQGACLSLAKPMLTLKMAENAVFEALRAERASFQLGHWSHISIFDEFNCPVCAS